MARTNKYAALCAECGARVRAGAGTLTHSGRKWEVRHVDCEAGGPGVIVTRFSSGAEVYQNRRGRCEDAPCCGCCS